MFYFDLTEVKIERLYESAEFRRWYQPTTVLIYFLKCLLDIHIVFSQILCYSSVHILLPDIRDIFCFKIFLILRCILPSLVRNIVDHVIDLLEIEEILVHSHNKHALDLILIRVTQLAAMISQDFVEIKNLNTWFYFINRYVLFCRTHIPFVVHKIREKTHSVSR